MEIREFGEKLTSLLLCWWRWGCSKTQLVGFHCSVGQPVPLYEAASANRVIIMSWRLNRGDYSGLAEYIAFSAQPWENGQLSALFASNRSIRRRRKEWVSERGREWERDPFEGSWGTNKLCLAQMGEKGRADCHLSGTLKCQSITPELLIVCSSKLLCEKSANRLFGERAISQWKSKAHFINAKNVTCHVEHTAGSDRACEVRFCNEPHGETFIWMQVFYARGVTKRRVRVEQTKNAIK